MSNNRKKARSKNVELLIKIFDEIENIKIMILDNKLLLDVGYITSDKERQPGVWFSYFILSLDFEYIDTLFAELNQMKFNSENSILYSEFNGEQIIIVPNKPEWRDYSYYFYSDEIPEWGYYEIKNVEIATTYKISSMSNIAFLKQILLLYEKGKKQEIYSWFATIPSDYPYDVARDLELKNEEVFNFLTAGRYTNMNIGSIRFESKSQLTIEDYIDRINSFSFIVALKKKLAIGPFRIEDKLPKEKLLIDDKEKSDLLIPTRKYDQNILYFYQMAISTTNPILQYISFYHIMEFFLEESYHKSLIDFVKGRWSDPSSDQTKDTVIAKFIRDFKKVSFASRSGEEKKNERKMLFETLKRFIPNIINIKSRLENLDPRLISYYKNHVVSFSKGKKIDFDVKGVYGNLCDRIYDTRNAIVHSKSTNYSSFRPFRDEEELKLEIPLMKAISEEIIHKSSEPLD